METVSLHSLTLCVFVCLSLFNGFVENSLGLFPFKDLRACVCVCVCESLLCCMSRFLFHVACSLNQANYPSFSVLLVSFPLYSDDHFQGQDIISDEQTDPKGS